MTDQKPVTDIILEPPLSEREDLAHLFVMDDGDMTAQAQEFANKQLPILKALQIA